MKDDEIKKIIEDEGANLSISEAPTGMGTRGCGIGSCRGMCYVAGICRHCITSSGLRD